MLGKRDDLDLRPVDFEALLPKLELTIGQVAKLADLSIRQVSYWTNKGILTASNPKKRVYRADALKKAILVKQCLDHGLSLHEAVDFTDRYLASAVATRAATRAGGREGTTDVRARRAEVEAPSRPAPFEPFLLERLGELRHLAAEIRQSLPALEDRAEIDLARTKLEVIAFFERNPYARDTAARIAQQLGRSPELVRRALESLSTNPAVRRVERQRYVPPVETVRRERGDR